MASMVRVDERVHAALREIAIEERRSIGQVIAEAVRRHQKEPFWRGVREDFARLKTDPAAWRDDQAEVALWDQTAGDGLEREAPYDTPEEEAELDADDARARAGRGVGSRA